MDEGALVVPPGIRKVVLRKIHRGRSCVLLWTSEKGNALWEEPKKVQLSSPEAVAALDFSEEALQGGCVAQWKADVPDCFYGLQLEPWQRPYFVLGDLRVKDLDEFLE